MLALYEYTGLSNNNCESKIMRYERFSEKRSGCSGRKCLIFLTFLFFCATAVFLSLFLVYYFKYEDREKDVKRSADPSRSGSELCNTVDCVKTASLVADCMNPEADPCTDFAEFACGNFYKTATFNEGESKTSPFSILADKNNKITKAIVSEDPKPEDWAYAKNMKNLYKSCMDEEKIEEIGVEPYLQTSYAKEWPTLIGQNWTGESQFDLDNVITRYFGVSVEPIVSVAIAQDLMNSSRYAIYLYDPDVFFTRVYFMRPRNDSVLMAYERYLRDTAIYLGAKADVAAKDAADVLDLEIRLSKITVPQEQRRNSFKMYNPTTLAALWTNYSYMDIPRGLRASFAIANLTLDDDQEIIVPFPSYYNQLESVINSTDKRTLQNIFGFKYALSKVGSLTEKLRQISFEFSKVYTGKTERTPRWKTCLSQASGAFSLGVSKEFVRRQFSESSKAYMNVMIDNLKASFNEILQEATWMGNDTKAEAHQKLAAMGRKIGYPDEKFSHEEIEEEYKSLVMTTDNLYKNQDTLFWNSLIKLLKRTTQPVDKTKWHMAMFEVNAYYSGTENEIVFPAGILQPPFFSKMFPDSMNYGAIGMVIGHEITHGFDDRGSQYDKEGKLRMWWQPEDRARFIEKGQCIIDQYGNFTDELAEMKLNGINTQGENVADNGGLKESYRAYKKMTMEKDDAKLLPGLKLTHDQLFFLAFAQLWCHKSTKARAIVDVSNGVHSPGNFRLMGTLQNSPDFAKAYKCPVGSPMNPEKKCSVW
ncbi:endothelin-converting enzyme 1 [Plakobranchus ocellatus]|uniref:Endothelin-converting enzyme 1 n=1 Tax=Plakobranchus ocellatus TaxID=259542 RepID=A0AAV3ZP42_9GAST|nr:endothelin-converting enzyme 1 [Plakobranchus ocellatus]